MRVLIGPLALCFCLPGQQSLQSHANSINANCNSICSNANGNGGNSTVWLQPTDVIAELPSLSLARSLARLPTARVSPASLPPPSRALPPRALCWC